MSNDPTGPGRADDATPGGETSGRDEAAGSPDAGPQAGDLGLRNFGSSTPGDRPSTSTEDADPEAAAGPSEGTPEDLRPGGERAGLDEDSGADIGDHGRETAA